MEKIIHSTINIALKDHFNTINYSQFIFLIKKTSESIKRDDIIGFNGKYNYNFWILFWSCFYKKATLIYIKNNDIEKHNINKVASFVPFLKFETIKNNKSKESEYILILNKIKIKDDNIINILSSFNDIKLYSSDSYISYNYPINLSEFSLIINIFKSGGCIHLIKKDKIIRSLNNIKPSLILNDDYIYKIINEILIFKFKRAFNKLLFMISENIYTYLFPFFSNTRLFLIDSLHTDNKNLNKIYNILKNKITFKHILTKNNGLIISKLYKNKYWYLKNGLKLVYSNKLIKKLGFGELYKKINDSWYSTHLVSQIINEKKILIIDTIENTYLIRNSYYIFKNFILKKLREIKIIENIYLDIRIFPEYYEINAIILPEWKLTSRFLHKKKKISSLPKNTIEYNQIIWDKEMINICIKKIENDIEDFSDLTYEEKLSNINIMTKYSIN